MYARSEGAAFRVDLGRLKICASSPGGVGQMRALPDRFVQERAGQDLIELGLLVGIITTRTITAIQAVRPKVTTYFTTLSGHLP